MATVCGVIQRVNKLISVGPVKARCATFSRLCCNAQPGNTPQAVPFELCRYNPELGDVVVGRVTEVCVGKSVCAA